MSYAARLILFLLLNFGALGIGGLFTRRGVVSGWYQGLNKAPWTPPGTVFGIAWTSIMICLGFYMAAATGGAEAFSPALMAIYVVQWLLNVLWNPLFFAAHRTRLALTDIIALLLSVIALSVTGADRAGLSSLLLLPYLLWLLVAISLNCYVVLKN